MPIIVLGAVTAILLNYWVVESLLAAHSEPARSWISDLGARSESTGWLFSGLDALSGLALCALTALLWSRVAPRSPMLRWGMVALAASAVCTVVDGLAPLSCAEALGSPCRSAHDLLDTLHAMESGISIVTAIAGFALLGEGFRRDAELRVLGVATYVCGVAWILCYGVIAVGFASATLDDVKGSFQRPSQVVFGVWVAVLAAALASVPGLPRGGRAGMLARR
jgi:hypothetical protein